MTITVTTAAESTDLTTLDNVKAEIGITVSDYDTILSRYISRASQTIVNLCGRDFAQQRITETMRSAGGSLLILSRAPVATLHSISYDSVAVASSNYYLDSAEAGMVRNPTGWTYTGFELDYSVDYTYGYVLPSFSSGTVDLPLDIEQACIDIVKAFYLTRKRDPSIEKEGVPSVFFATYGSKSTGFGGQMTLPATAAALLRPYKRHKV